MILGIDASRANREQKTGVEWYAYFLIQELKKIVPSDWEVRLYCDVPLTGEIAQLPPHWQEVVLKWPPKRLWTQVRLSWEMITRTPDVLFVPAHVQPYVHPKKTVLTVHDVAAKATPGAYNRFEKWYSLWTAEEALQKLPAVIVPTNAVKKDLLALFPAVTEQTIRVIHHGINPAFLVESSLENNAEVLSKKAIQKPFVIAVGRIEHKKNTVGLMRSFARAVELGYKGSLVLVGKPGFGYQEVERVMKKSVVKNFITMIPWLDTHDLVTIMRQADALAFPSLAEGFGLPVLEAMSLGVPVIASDLPVLHEVAGGAAKYVTVGDDEQLARAIVEISQPVNQARYRLLGKERAALFTWSQSARQTWEVIQSLV